MRMKASDVEALMGMTCREGISAQFEMTANGPSR